MADSSAASITSSASNASSSISSAVSTASIAPISDAQLATTNNPWNYVPIEAPRELTISPNDTTYNILNQIAQSLQVINQNQSIIDQNIQNLESNLDTEIAQASADAQTAAINKVVQLMANGNVPHATLADLATRLATARTIAMNGAVTATATSFDGSENITIPATSVDGTKVTGEVANASSADSAVKLTTARTIGGVPFDGSANIDLPGVNVAGNLVGNADSSTTTVITPITTAVNFNSFNAASGFYSLNALSGMVSAPVSGVLTGLLQVYYFSDSSNVLQIFTSMGTTNTIYKRSWIQSTATWSAWS